MIGPITACWAKLATDADGNTIRDAAGAPVAWHPLAHHSADVAALLLALLDQRVLRRWLAALDGAQDLDPVQCQRLAYFASLHDLGKVNRGFQNRSHHSRRPTAGHVGPLLQLLAGESLERNRAGEAMRWSEMAAWFNHPDGASDLLHTTICHHGRPVRVEGGSGLSLWQATGDFDPLREAAALCAAARRWLPLAFGEGVPLQASASFQHGFNGLLTLADWIASDTSLFRFAEVHEQDRFAWTRTRAGAVLRRLGLNVTNHRRALGFERPTYATIAEGDPRQLQAVLLDLPTDSRGSITVLEAETGAGKTEAAIARFASLFHAAEVDGMYFALPTRTAATQIHRRVHQALSRAFPDRDQRPPVVLAVPGYLAVDDAHGVQVARFGVRWPDRSATWRGRGWAAENSKRFLAGAVVVGTVDQVLLSALAVTHSHMRAAALARHLLVVDEVHASDAYMTTILEAVLARHMSAGGHVLLMSATLGAAARERLLRPQSFAAAPALESACATPYPLVTHAAPPLTTPELLPLTPATPRNVVVERATIADTPAAVARLALHAAHSGARVLVIRNTVADCVATQSALESLADDPPAASAGDTSILLRCNGVAAPHHSRFSREDRQALDDAIERRFGKSSAFGAVVAVATQTVQQSLDLDGDLLITDLCPFDVLLQRLGRLHRHSRARPDGFAQPRVVVVLPEDRNLGRWFQRDNSARGPHGFGTVYQDLRVLEATWQQLEQCAVLELPGMSRSLVEATTHPDSLAELVASHDAAWVRHSAWVTGVLMSHSRIAAGHLVDWSTSFANTAFPDDGVRIGTRLGAEDRVVEFDPAVAAESSPFGNEIRRLNIPHWLVHGAEGDAGPQNVRPGSGAVQFDFGKDSYVYDRLGLRKTTGTSTTPEEDDG